MKEFQAFSHQNNMLHRHVVYKKFRQLILQTKCLDKVTHVLVGLSGGVDSAVLLHMLCEYEKKEKGPKVFALHVNHAQRGAESDRDESVAHEVAVQAGCTFQSLKLENASVGAGENELRDLRHQALKNFAQKNSCERIALGHHMDDQVETFLFRLIRGSDIKGLSSMKPFNHPFIRPLLECTRKEIESAAEEGGIPFVHDSSNFSNAAARNYLRNIVIPALSSKLDPQVAAHIFDMAQSISDIDAYMVVQATETIDRIRLGPHEYSVKDLQKIPPVLRKKMIHLMYTYICKDKGSLSRDQIDMIDRWMETTQSPKFLLLPSNIRVEKKQSVLTFSIVHE
jgi:tRNA(Ile)-lysidine synthase